MNNKTAEDKIKDCLAELNQINNIINALGPFNNTIPYLTKYAIIKTCGTLEQCFKTILADKVTLSQNQQIINYIDVSLRNSSMNPSFYNINKSLNKFDKAWNKKFRKDMKLHPNIKRIEDSIDSLNTERNNFAHGGNPSATISDIIDYFNDAIILIKNLDNIII